MQILALSAFHQDAAAALLVDGVPVAVGCEARFTRKRGERAFPIASVQACLERANTRLDAIDYVAFAGKPLAQFERRVEALLALAPRGFGKLRHEITDWLTRDIGCARALDKGLGVRGRRYVFVPQHEALAAAAFYTSRFESCALLTADGRTGWTSVAIGRGSSAGLEALAEQRFPHGFEALAAALRAFLALEGDVDEDELVALAARGRPVHLDRLHRELVDAREQGAFASTRAAFDVLNGASSPDVLERIFGTPPRARGAAFEAAHADAAAALRDLSAELLLNIAREARRTTNANHLAAALHVPFGSVAWARVALEAGFERVHHAPSGSAAALGAAFFVEHAILGRERRALVPGAFARAGIASTNTVSASTPARAIPTAFDVDRVVNGIAAGQRIGLACGRAESGLVAAGARCVLADAQSPAVWNALAAQRGSLLGGTVRGLCVPFAKAHEWFDVPRGSVSYGNSCVWSVRTERRAQLAGTEFARVLTVDPDRHPEVARILDAFERAQSLPVLVHIPLALPGEPLVARIEDARRVFLSSDLDALVLDDRIEEKSVRHAQIEARRIVNAHAESDAGLDALWACPACTGALSRDESGARCTACKRVFVQEDGIWRLFHPHEPHEGDVTDLVKGFYEEHPFPNYDVGESVGSLMEKSRRGVYARQLFEQIPFDARVLEVGCGTGQLSNFLGIGCRTVVGTDLCLNSLRLAETFRSGQGLSRVRFAQMNLFRPAFAPASFDVVLCNGVLHHTADPRGGFESIARLVKPGGLIVIGLYNTYGRLLLDARRVVFRLTGGRFKWIDSYLRNTPMSKEKIDAWFHDQYRHPHESKHTMGEVLQWFQASGFEFVHGVPPTSPWTDYSEDAALFEREEAGTKVERALAQTKMIATGSREGGFFIMIGRKVG